MPTGYTAAILDGITFEQFALNCARAFGALITMRDEPFDVPIPPRMEPSSFYQRTMEREHLELERLLALTPGQIRQEAEKAYTEAVASYYTRKHEREEQRAKYEAILAQAHAWQPPTSDHTGLKEFMVEQIEESIRFDCSGGDDPEPVRLTPEDWHAKRVAEVRWTVGYCEQHHRDEVERTHSRNCWIDALRKSL
jgi:hypothetical protein